MNIANETAPTRERRGGEEKSIKHADSTPQNRLVGAGRSEAPRLTVVRPAAAGELSGDKPALIPPGEYQLRFTHWQTAILWGRSHKVILHCIVCDLGPHFGVKLRRFYNVEKIIGRPCKDGRFKVGWNHDLVREYAQLLPMPHRLDRLNLERLESLLIVGRVETTTTTARQKRLPDALHYSVVRELLRVEAGNRVA